MDALLDVRGLTLHYRTSKGVVQAVDGLDFTLDSNEAMALIGDSGCGKSSLAKALLRLLPRNVHTYAGEVRLNGQDVMALKEDQFRKEIRWNKIALVSQAAMNALNPVIKVGEQVAEPLIVHFGVDKGEAYDRAAEVFKMVGVPIDFLHRYAFELSGGMRQRAILAMALATNPDVIVMDEPTSALDVLTQANIMNVFKQVKREFGTSFILITHDIATSSEIADKVAVMYAGQIVEISDAERFFNDPLHPYSHKLMASVPKLRDTEQPEFIPGQAPSLFDPPEGCRFAERCPHRFDRCDEDPSLAEPEGGRHVKCWLYW